MTKSGIGIWIIAVLFITGLVYSQSPDTLWTNGYGGWLWDYAYDVKSTDDGGFITAGLSNSYISGSIYLQMYLVKTNGDGDMLWYKVIGPEYSDRGYSIQITEDGGFIITGSSEENTGGDGLNVYLVRTDCNGDTLWTKTYGGSLKDEGETVVITEDQGFAIAGYTYSYGAGDKDFYLIRTDSSGDTLWTKTYGGSGDDLAWSVAAVPGGGFIVAGRTASSGAGSWDVWLVRTNADGDMLWNKTFGGGGWDSALEVQCTADSGFIVNGYTMSSGAGQTDYYMLKIDASGNLLWSRTYGGSNYDNGTCIEQLPDGGYLLGGYTKSFGDTNGDFWIIRTDANGDSLWSQIYGGSGTEQLNGMDLTFDGGYVLAGKTTSLGNSSSVWLIRLAQDCTAVGESEYAQSMPSRFSISPVTPNPVYSHMSFDLHTIASGPAYVSVYDIHGRCVDVIYSGQLAEGTRSFMWTVPQTIANGTYIVRASCGDIHAAVRIAVIK
ncbi:MAG: T9SS type A sorting domain-containing protein [Candidatus Aegiribacteria sp.]|nr:T9SS type A sorting domain-containing protein [Candidatus Aegiribacteria sp.]